MIPRQFECVVAVVKYGNFTRAAEALFITQPALSRRISSLEAEVGFKIFDRSCSSKIAKLTPAGKLYLDAIQEVIRILEHAEQCAHTMSAEQTGSLSICIRIDGREVVAEKALQEYSQSFPNVSTHVLQYTQNEMELALLQNRVDLVFINSASSQIIESFPKVLIESRPRCAVVPKEHPWSKKSNICLSELCNQPLVMLSPDIAPHYKTFCQFCFQQNFKPKIAKYGFYLSEVLNYVSYGFGIGICSERASQIASDQLRFIPITDIPMLDHVAVWNSQNNNPCLPPFVQILSKMIASCS